MSISKLRLIGLSSIDLPILSASPSDPYVLKAADGLGPPEIDVIITNGVFLNKTPQDREPVLLIGLNPNYEASQSVADLRKIMYGLLTPGASDIITMKIYDAFDSVFALTKGYVKKFEIVPFNKEPEVQITIACPEPYLEAENAITVVPDGKATFEIVNQGSAPTGFEMEFVFSSDSPVGSEFIITDENGRAMIINHRFLNGQRLIISTTPRKKYIRLYSAGLTTTLLSKFDKESDWLELYGGVNTFTTNRQNFDWNYVRYTPKYWGV